MKIIAGLLLITAAILLFVTVVYAEIGLDDRGNPNDPNINERANACYDGGTLAGKCDSQEMWDAGWYLIRWEQGIISGDQFPDVYRWLLPADVQAQPTVIGIPTLTLPPL